MARVCVIRQSYVPLDPRVRREVSALVSVGHHVDVICLRRANEPLWERDGRLTILRLPLGRPTGSLARRLVQYLCFLLLTGGMCGARHLRRAYAVVQVNTVPDSLVFAALIPRLGGAKVLLDLHECMPEFFAAEFGRPMDSLATRLLASIEQLSIRFADLAITCTDQMREQFVRRGAPESKVIVVLNGADEDVFDAGRHGPPPRRKGFHLISHGTVEERYGLDTIVRAVALLKDDIPGLRLNIVGEGTYLTELRELVTGLDVEEQVQLTGRFVPLDDLVAAIADADAGVVAIRQNQFRDLVLCNKMYDFIAMRKPAIVSRTRSVDDYFGDDCFQMFVSGDEQDLARAIRELYENAELGERLVDRAWAAARSHRWPEQRKLYLGVVDRLLGLSASAVDPPPATANHSAPERPRA